VLKKDDVIQVQNMPARVVDVDQSGQAPLYLILINSPSIRWMTEDQLRQAGALPNDPQTGQPTASVPQGVRR
jgi:hypothetical protein